MSDIEKFRERLNILNDYLFQKVFGEKGDETQLLGFLNAVLQSTHKDNLEVIKIIESKTFRPDVLGLKGSILDVLAETAGGIRINIEVQLNHYRTMPKRSLFYWSKLYISDLESGEDYEKLVPVITINIIDFEIIKLPEFHTSYHLREDAHPDYILTDDIETHYIEMPKFRRLPNKDIENNDIHRWLAFFDRETPPEVMKEILDMDSAIKKAYGKMDEVSQDEESMQYYKMREKALHDYNTGIHEAKEEGKLEGKLESAKIALRKGYPVEDVADISCLDLATIEQLKAELQ